MIFDSVKRLCAEHGITIKRLESDLGFSSGSVCKWNESEPGIWKVQKVADYLGVPIESLLGGGCEGGGVNES